ncbi:ArsR family transcriptional regulator [Halobacteriales archaeon QS_4_70_19]|jgi:DNA-binding transcriptional ArsR family regulator|nr:MAG: ArsR family transcriptional regulator [Halobacteriales archaeon QS_4_70_19]
MDAVLWQVLAGTRGGPNRARLLRALNRRPRNANRLAEALDLSYNTVRHHLDVLAENDVVVPSGEDYGEVYLPSDRTRDHWDTVEEILEQLEEVGPPSDDGGQTGSESESAEPPQTDSTPE